MDSSLLIVVVGASGDLAKKKTYPSLLELMEGGYLPANTTIWGFARSDLGRKGLHERLKPFLLKSSSPESVDRFLQMCYYHKGAGYDDVDSWRQLEGKIGETLSSNEGDSCNRLFYFAIPPSAFGPSGTAIKASGIMAPAGDDFFNRFVIEKPFGRDSESSAALAKELTALFEEDFTE